RSLRGRKRWPSQSGQWLRQPSPDPDMRTTAPWTISSWVQAAWVHAKVWKRRVMRQEYRTKHLATGLLRALVRCAKIRSYQHIGCSRRRGPLETAAEGGSVWPTIVGSSRSPSDLVPPSPD